MSLASAQQTCTVAARVCQATVDTGAHCSPQDVSTPAELAARDPRKLMYGQSTAWPLLHMPSPHASSHGAASVALGDSFKVRFKSPSIYQCRTCARSGGMCYDAKDGMLTTCVQSDRGQVKTASPRG